MAKYLLTLACGHTAPSHSDQRLDGRTIVGVWITCLDGHCQGQRKITSVTEPAP